ncbi:MAG: M28 family peptidase [Burkholderiales bacterium]|nr:M28 family peptidase [Burkholderiales bacterium]
MNAALGLAAAAALVALLLWVMVSVPGESWRGALPPLREDEAALAERLKKHVATLAAGERNTRAPARLEAAARYIEAELKGAGYRVRAQPYDSGDGIVRNLESVREGRIARSLVVGAHYDSVFGSPGANDNGSGVARRSSNSRAPWRRKPARHTLRFVFFFANEEPPYFATAAMGSRASTPTS